MFAGSFCPRSSDGPLHTYCTTRSEKVFAPAAIDLVLGASRRAPRSPRGEARAESMEPLLLCVLGCGGASGDGLELGGVEPAGVDTEGNPLRQVEAGDLLHGRGVDDD